MPILRRHYNYMKIYRPNGTLYSRAERVCAPGILALTTAVNRVYSNFRNEFKRDPEGNIVIEIVVDSFDANKITKADATLYEMPED